MKVDEAMWDLAANAALQAKLRALRDGKTDEWTVPEFVHYLLFYKRLGKKTAAGYRRQLAFMERHPVAPVSLHTSRADLIETFSIYVNFREQVEMAGPSALKGDHQAVRALGAFRSIPDNVWPTAPLATRGEASWVPSPEQVHELLNAPFGAQRSYEHQLTRYMLGYSFGIGVRPPSELLTARVQDIDLDHGILIVSEAKKKRLGGHVPKRELVVSPRWLIKSNQRLCLRNWIEKMRPMCNPKTDALFPNVNGKPFASEEAARAFLIRHVCGDKRANWRCWDGDEARSGPRFEWYSPYVARHWSCNARLIETARTVAGHRVYDWPACARWHGHESVQMTMNTYARAVEVNEVRYGTEWLSRAFGGSRVEA